MTTKLQNPAKGIAFVVAGILAISVNDMLIKLLSGGYPLHQMVFIRSVVGLGFTVVMIQIEGGWRILRTDQPWLHLFRCAMLVTANLTFFTALAALSLAETTAIFFISPLLITLLGIPILGEKVGSLRLGAVVVGFIGVVIMTRPWQSGDARDIPFAIYLLPIIAAAAYAITQVLTRKLGSTTQASALAAYLQGLFIVVLIAHIIIVVYAIYRMAKRRAVAAADKARFILSNPLRGSTPQTPVLSGRSMEKISAFLEEKERNKDKS